MHFYWQASQQFQKANGQSLLNWYQNDSSSRHMWTLHWIYGRAHQVAVAKMLRSAGRHTYADITPRGRGTSLQWKHLNWRSQSPHPYRLAQSKQAKDVVCVQRLGSLSGEQVGWAFTRLAKVKSQVTMSCIVPPRTQRLATPPQQRCRGRIHNFTIVCVHMLWHRKKTRGEIARAR